MDFNFKKEIKKLERKNMTRLRNMYKKLFGEETLSKNRSYLIKKIVWRIQSDALGGLSERARKKAAEIANESDLRVKPPKDFITEQVSGTVVPSPNDVPRLPLAGTIIEREYKGSKLQVTVLKNGFEFEGEIYPSLSAVAKAATNSHVNGYNFFRLRPAKKRSKVGSAL